MINQLVPYSYSVNENSCIALALNNWESQRGCIIQLKRNLNAYFDTTQNEKCCYCGLLYDRSGRGEIEHIVPKGIHLYPQFSYTSYNLAKVCQLCNSSSMKHFYDSIAVLAPNYNQCTFKIVHPYLDNHMLHYKWNYGLRSVIISVANNSPKALESIRLFQLDSVKRTRARASQKNQERIDAFYNISAAIKLRIRSTLKFK